MKKFFKENSYTVVRMLVFQLGIAIMGFITSYATVSMKAKWMYPASSVFCIVFYLFLIYVMGYENGQKDGIRIESGKITYQPWRYFLVGLLANLPNILLGVLTLIFRLIINAPLLGDLDPTVTYTPAWAASAYATCNMIARAIQSMYLGLTQTISFENVILLVLIPLPAIIVAGVSYILGIKYKDGFLPKKQKQSDTKRYS